MSDLIPLYERPADGKQSAFPVALDTFGDLDKFASDDPVQTAINRVTQAVIALQTKIGADPGLWGMLFRTDGTPDATVQAALSTNLTGNNNDIVYTAVPIGTDGNLVTVAYADPGAGDATLSVTVDGNAITVHLATDSGGTITSTADDIKTEIGNTAEADALVQTADKGGNDGSGVVTEMAASPLIDGADATGRGDALPGALCVDYTGQALYMNSGTADEPVWDAYPAP